MPSLGRVRAKAVALVEAFKRLVHRDSEDVRQVAALLERKRVRVWKATMRNEAGSLGFNVTVDRLEGSSWDWIRRQSLEDARSIVRTHNRDRNRFLDKFMREHPEAGREEIAQAYEEWLRRRVGWKSRQIATQTEYSTQAEARRRFRERNKLTGAKYVFVGPPPVCEDCADKFAMGVVSWEITQKYPAPRHIGCTHQWRVLSTTAPKLKRSELWIG